MKKLNDNFDKIYDRFYYETMEFISDKDEFKYVFDYYQNRCKNKLKKIKFMNGLFHAWETGRLGWYLNHQLIELENA